MSRSERPRSSSTSDVPPPSEAFEVGRTTLRLDDISEQELEALSFNETDQDRSILNLSTVSGMSLLLASLIYLITEINALPSSSLFGPDIVLPLLVGTAVLLLGGSLLAWRASRSAPIRPSPPPPPGASNLDAPHERERKTASNRLVRSRTDKKLLGVCGGLAEYLSLDPTLVRIAFVTGTIFFGSLLLVYIGLAFAMPKAPPSASNKHPTLPHDVPRSD